MLPDPSFELLSRPGGFTRHWYESLPAVYRDLDLRGQQLLRFLSLLGDQADEVQQLAEQAQSGKLTDPLSTPDALVPWLAQLLGLTTVTPIATTELRARMTSLDSIWAGGSPAALIAIVAPLLTGDQWASIRPHEGTTDGDPWTIGVFVRLSEAPDPLSLLADAITAAGAKPAGFALTVETVTVTWASIDALGDTWADIDAVGHTWDDLENAAW